MLTRWDPFRDMMSMRRMMDRMIDQSLTVNGETNQADWALPLDVVEHETEFVVRASLPGVQSDDLEITFNKGMLSIKGELKDENTEEHQGQYHLRERRWGSFSRTISLPNSVKADDIQAEFNDGILTLHLPKTEEVKPKRIAIHPGGQGEKVLDAKASQGKQSRPEVHKETLR